MTELDSKNPLSFTKSTKQVVRKGPVLVQAREHNLKPPSTSKSNKSKISQRLQSKQKKSSNMHAFLSQKSPYYHDGNNAKSQRCRIDNEQSGKTLHQHDCWSIQTSVQTKNISKAEQNSQSRLIRKERSCREIDRSDKKDRKFSQNIHKVVHGYQNLKEEHMLERKIMEMVLNEKQLHRLNKIYAVEETQYMIRVLNAEKK